jgi:Mg2+-importing ATPase
MDNSFIFKLEDFKDKSNADLYAALQTAPLGLSEKEAAARFLVVGANVFEERKKLGPLRIFFSKFKNPMLVILIVASIVTGFLGQVFDAIVIISMVLLSAVIDFTNTYRSSVAAEKLMEKVTITTAVIRAGRQEERPVSHLVPGDMVAISAGDIIPADCLLIEGKDVFINESSLTGESLPVEKLADLPTGSIPRQDPSNSTPSKEDPKRVLYMGTSVVSGVGKALIAVTGKRTRFGQIASKLGAIDTKSEFERDLSGFSFFIFRTTMFLILLILLLNIIVNHRSPLETLLFAVAIAVGLTPELLPVIITANLAKGAIRMSKAGVIVKNLSAIHNFGSIDVLCTDKTGTLTEDKIALFRYVDAEGKDSEEVLTFGYLSSFHLTGIRGSLDRAIQEYRKIDIAKWTKLDEIPFDYERRRDSVVVENDAKVTLIAKGAPEDILQSSLFFEDPAVRMTESHLKQAQKEYDDLSAEGFRVLGVAVKALKKALTYSKEDEKDMVFMGFLAFLDPPKRSAKEALRKMEAHGIVVKIISGDNALVTKKIAIELELPILGIITGDEITDVGESELEEKVANANIFARITPEQKERIINAVKARGHVVGYIGDGINDLLSLRAADVGISVNNAVDIAKSTASIILLNKGLEPIMEGIIEGRKTFANIFKYIMMALSSNFGNMASMPIGSLFLPFLPMLPSQIIFNNFLYDMSQITIPFDRVDVEFLKKPKKFNMAFLKHFMFIFGPLSSLFDFATFCVLLFVFHFGAAQFQTGWFLESIATQTLVVGCIRSRKFFFRSRPGKLLLASTIFIVVAAWVVPYTFIGKAFDLQRLAPVVLMTIAGIVLVYLFSVEALKYFFYRKWGYLIEK